MAAVVSPAAAVLAIVGFATLSLLALTGLPGPALGTGTAPRPGQPGLATALRGGPAHLLRSRPLRSVTVATSVAWGRWHARWRPERVVLASLAGSGLVLLSWPLAGTLAVLLGLAVAAGLAQGAGMPALFTTRQRYTPSRWYAQISTTGASLKLGAMAAGAAVSGQLSPTIGPAAVLGLAAACQLVAAAIGAGMLRARRSTGDAAVAGLRQPA